MTNHIDSILTDTPKRRKIRKESRRLHFKFYQILYGPIVYVKAIYRQIIVLSAMIVSGAAIFVHFDHLPVIGALLASVSTITTIGLYTPNSGNFFTMDSTRGGALNYHNNHICGCSGISVAKQRQHSHGWRPCQG